MSPIIETFFDAETNNATHLVRDPGSNACALIDTVLDFDPASGHIKSHSADKILEYLAVHELDLVWILETHIHADHLTGAAYVRDKTGARTAMGEGVVAVQERFAKTFNCGADFTPDGSQFDHLFADGESVTIGGMEGRVMETPGHTSDGVSYLIGDAVFTGDTFFMPDSGTARCDFPGGSAEQLYDSLQKIFALPDETRQFVNHDYGAGGERECRWETTIAEQRADNIHVGGGKSRAGFVALRQARDETLSAPRLLYPAIQVNMRAGALPVPEDNGVSYLKIPLEQG